MRKTYIKQIAAFFIGLAVIILAVISGAGTAFAADTASDVLNDLYTDSSFNAAAYPEKAKDYSLNVIQIAESTDGELLVYVYQPYGNLKASSINISRYPDNTTATSFLNYKLEYLNSSGTLYKYKVVGFELLKNALRVYNVSNIYRPWDKNIDKPAGNDNKVTEVENAVGQCWTATTVNGSVTYSMTTSEVIEIKNKYVGYANYNDGYNLGWDITSGATSAHFVAFSTNKRIDKLKSVELTFKEREVTYRYCANPIHVGGHIGLGHKMGDKFEYSYGEAHDHEPNPLVIRETATGTNASGGYEWKRIQKTSEFLKNVPEDYKITQEGTGGLSNTQWVLSFYETQISNKAGNAWLPLMLVPVAGVAGIIAATFSNDIDVKTTQVSEVTLLLLEFETDGKTYRLGAVDNKQTGSDKPVIYPEIADFWQKALWWLKNFWWVIPLGILGIALAGFLLYVFAPLIGSFLKWIITLPFRFIKRLFGGEERREAAPAKSNRSKSGKSKKKRQ